MDLNEVPPSFRRGRRAFCAAAAAVPLAWLAGCASLVPRSYTFSESDLAELLSQHFPAIQGVAQIVDVTVSSPRVWLLPERNRLGASFDLRAADRIFRSGVQGRLALDSGLRFEPSDDSIRLSQVRVQQLELDHGAMSDSLPAQRLGALVAERMLEDLPIYRLKPAQAQALHGSGLKPHVEVTARGLELTLAPP